MADTLANTTWDLPERTPVTYHYCSLATLMSIVKNQQLWLADITRSNDSAELGYGFLKIREALETEITRVIEQKHFPEGQRELDPATLQMLQSFLENVRSIGTSDQIRCYAICFSTEKDLLSQWRAYGDDGKGVSIGFDLGSLCTMHNLSAKVQVTSNDSLLDKSGFQDYLPVCYGAEGIIDVIMRPMLAMTSFGFDQLNSTTDNLIAEFFSPEHLLNWWVTQLLPKSAFCKNPYFSEEKEWRLALWGATANSPDMAKQRQELTHTLKSMHPNIITSAEFDMLAQRGTLNPILKLGVNLSIVMKEVVLGPKCQVTKSIMEEFLRSEGLADAQVSQSEGTYR